MLNQNKTTVIRLKSDNYDCYVSVDAYKSIRLEMSSGDFGSHKTRFLEVDGNQLEKIKSTALGFLDLVMLGDKDCTELLYWSFHQYGDCNYEVAV
jgi:hypothetical protein